MENSRDILVLDGLYSDPLIRETETFLLGSSWRFSEVASAHADAPRHWATELSPEAPLVATIIKGFTTALDGLGQFSLARVYCNAHVVSDCPLPHVDSANPQDRTVLYYANSNWAPKLSGETVFFKNDEIVQAILPKPGRVVIFNSALEHCARVPTRLAPGLRLTMAFKYKHLAGEKT